MKQAGGGGGKGGGAKGAKKGSALSKFDVELQNVVFESLEEDSFRVSLRSNDDGGCHIWLENRRDKRQYSITVTDLKEHSGEGAGLAPAPVVFALLKKSLENCVSAADSKGKVEEEVDMCPPVADAEATSAGINLKLTLNMSNTYYPVFTFALAQLEVDAVEVLKSQLKDAREEIEVLKARIPERAFLSLASVTVATNQQLVAWDSQVRRLITESHFRISANAQQVTVLRRGVYQINVRLGQCNSSNGRFLALMLGGAVFAQSYHCDSDPDENGYQNTVQLNEVCELQADCVLSVRCGANSNSLGEANSNAFTIVLLQSL